MVETLKGWIVTICTMVIFITAIEMILPDNKMKGYCKFVMGLILMSVIVSPIVKIINKNVSLTQYINQAGKLMDNDNYKSDMKKYEEKDEESTLDQFKLNVEDTCTKLLKTKFPNKNYSVDAKVSLDKDTGVVSVSSISVGVKNEGIENIKKIQIGKDSEKTSVNKSVDDITANNIVTCLSDEIKISRDKITVYRL